MFDKKRIKRVDRSTCKVWIKGPLLKHCFKSGPHLRSASKTLRTNQNFSQNMDNSHFYVELRRSRIYRIEFQTQNKYSNFFTHTPASVSKIQGYAWNIYAKNHDLHDSD